MAAFRLPFADYLSKSLPEFGTVTVAVVCRSLPLRVSLSAKER
jgi:hypothetical protein